MKPEVFMCECYDPLHNVQISPFDQEYNELFINVVVSSDQNIWKRIKNAFKLIFKQEDVTVGDIVLNGERAKELAAYITTQLTKENI